MKKIFSSILIAAVILSCAFAAYAEVPALSENMFKYAKAALGCLASGDFDKVVTNLPFSDISPSADEWRSFARGSFSSLNNPQSKYAVAYWTGRAWKLAVPVETPSSDSVDAFVLVSEDGRSFTGYGCSSWGKVRSEFQSSAYVVWNDEYHATTSVIIENDQP